MSDKKTSYSFIAQSVLRQGYSFFQSESFVEWHLALSLSTSNNLSFPYSCLLLLSRHSITIILSSTFPSSTCFRRQFLHKMWPIDSAFFLFLACSTFLFFILYFFNPHTIGPTDFHPTLAPLFQTFKVFPIYLPQFPHFCTTQSYAQTVTFNLFQP